MYVQAGAFDFLLRAFQWRLVDAHTVREACFEQIVIPSGGVCNGLCQVQLLAFAQIDQRSQMLQG